MLYIKMQHLNPQRSPGPAHSEPKAISPFALPGVKKRRLLEDKPIRYNTKAISRLKISLNKRS